MFESKGIKKQYKFFITVFLVGLCALTMFITVGYSALNKSIQISGDIDYTKYEVWAENLSFDTSVTHVECDTDQCMLDCIADESLCP